MFAYNHADWYVNQVLLRAKLIGAMPQSVIGALTGLVEGHFPVAAAAHYSDGWQLIINTGTTIVTFLMVFLIQNTQNRDAHAVHLKLDELIRANAHARNSLLALEDMSDDELARLQGEFEELRDRVARARTGSRADVATRSDS